MAKRIGQVDFTRFYLRTVWALKSRWPCAGFLSFGLQASWVNQCGQSRSQRERCLSAICSNLGAPTTFQLDLNFYGFILKLSMPETSGAPRTYFSGRKSRFVQEAKECTLFSLRRWFFQVLAVCWEIAPMLLERVRISCFSASTDIFRSDQSKGLEVCLSKLRLWKVFLADWRSFAVRMCSLLVGLCFLQLSPSSLAYTGCLNSQDNRLSFSLLKTVRADCARTTSLRFSQSTITWASLVLCTWKGLGLPLPGTLSKP